MAPRYAAGILALVFLALAGGATDRSRVGTAGAAQPAGASGIEPSAGMWRTWVLTSGRQLRPAAPPDRAATLAEIGELKSLAAQRDPATLDRIAYWDAGAPSYRWVEIGLARILQGPPTPMLARQLALLNVAVYDALVAAWDAKYAYNRPRPSEVDSTLATAAATPRSPSYPSEHAVAAGAASSVLAYLFPDQAAEFTAQAEEAARSRLLAGVQYPSDAQAGLELGRAVAALVIEQARNDGSGAAWTGTTPSGPGYWTGMNPVLPTMGTWKTWVLPSGDHLRPPPPPAHDSAQMMSELAEIKAFERTFATNAKAFAAQTTDGIFGDWYTIAGQRIFEYKLDGNAPRAARIYALMSVAHYDAAVACWDAKFEYWAIRPFQLDPTVTTLFPTPNHPSYPAAHGCLSGAVAAILAHLFPREAASITAKADDNAMSRLWAGIHFPSDIEAGLTLGRRVAELVIDRVRTDGAQ